MGLARYLWLRSKRRLRMRLTVWLTLLRDFAASVMTEIELPPGDRPPASGSVLHRVAPRSGIDEYRWAGLG